MKKSLSLVHFWALRIDDLMAGPVHARVLENQNEGVSLLLALFWKLNASRKASHVNVSWCRGFGAAGDNYGD